MVAEKNYYLCIYMNTFYLTNYSLFPTHRKLLRRSESIKHILALSQIQIIVFFLNVHAYLQFTHYLRVGEALSAKKEENCSTVKKKKKHL